MSQTIIWEQNSGNPDNFNNFNTICEWWSKLDNQEVNLAQRLIPDNGNLLEIDWQKQRFDEKFIINSPEVRGITLYGRKQNQEREFSYTVSELELNLGDNELYIYLQSRDDVVIKIWQPKITYQVIKLNNFKIVTKKVDKNCLILLTDEEQKIEINFSLTSEQKSYLLSQLSEN
jgi:hypothetical protein